MNWIYAVDFSIKWFHDLIRYFMILFHCTIEASHCISLLVLTTHFMGHSYIVSFLKNSHYCHRHREFGQIWVKWPVLASLKIFEPSDIGVSGLFKCLNFSKSSNLSELSDDGSWKLWTWLSWFDFIPKSVWFDTLNELPGTSWGLFSRLQGTLEDFSTSWCKRIVIWHFWPPDNLIM